MLLLIEITSPLTADEMTLSFRFIILFYFTGIILFILYNLLKNRSSSIKINNELWLNQLILAILIFIIEIYLIRVIDFNPNLYVGGLSTSYSLWLLFSGFPIICIISTIIFSIILRILRFSRYDFHQKRLEKKEFNEDRFSGRILRLERNRKIFHLLLFFMTLGFLWIVDIHLTKTIKNWDRQIYWGDFEGAIPVPSSLASNGFSVAQVMLIGIFYGTTCVCLIIEFARLHPWFYFPFIAHVEKTLRASELRSFASHTHIAVGFLIVAALVPANGLLASLSIFSLGDTMAAVIGRKWGKHKITFPRTSKKSWEGLLAGITFTFLGAYPFVGASIALSSSLLFLILDILTPEILKISDNLLIPLASAIMFVILAQLNVNLEFPIYSFLVNCC